MTISITMAMSVAGCLAPAGEGSDEDVGSHGSAIIGGSRATAYPEAALIHMKRDGRPIAACSGSLIAPTVVLTAGHCVHSFDGWDVAAPYASGQRASASRGVTLDWKTDAETVDPNLHDVGLVFLDDPIVLDAYPALTRTPLADGAKVVNIGRIDSGKFSNTDLFVSKPLAVKNAADDGFVFDYIAREIIQSGDSGGPDMKAGTHTIVAVNSGAGGGTEVLARTDLVYDWILQQAAAQGATLGGEGEASAE
jgi:Trypsin